MNTDLRALREREGLTLQTCASALGMTRQGYGKIELGHSRLKGTPSGLLSLSDLLKVSIWELASMDAEPYASELSMIGLSLLAECPNCGAQKDFDANARVRGGKVSIHYSCGSCGFVAEVGA